MECPCCVTPDYLAVNLIIGPAVSSPCLVTVCFSCLCRLHIQKRLPWLKCLSSLPWKADEYDGIFDNHKRANAKYMLMESRILIYPEVGPICFERSTKASRVSISIRPARGVRVAVPLRVSFFAAEQAILPKISWIKRHLAAIRIDETHCQELERNFSLADFQKARLLLAERLMELALLHGFIYNKITVRCQKTRWGSCSSRNDISLNVKLAYLPVELSDYVILHELVHTRIRNHGLEFKNCLLKLLPNASELRTRLRRYQPILL